MTKMAGNVGLLALSAAFLVAMSGVAQASPGYCNNSYGGTTTQTDGLAVGDATLAIDTTTYTAVDCYGIVNAGSSDIPNNLNYLNALAWQNFVGGVKDDLTPTGTPQSVIVDGIRYTLTTTTTTPVTGINKFQNWTLDWFDTNGATAPNLPVKIDLVAQWNGGSKDVFYLFDDVTLPSSPLSGAGSFNIKVMNPPRTSDIGTSHVNLFFTDTTPVSSSSGGGPGSVPEPASLALIGIGMLGLAAMRRRSKPV